MVFAARMLIRFASMLPDAIDLRQTARDLESLATILRTG
jgi:hypothetical protein